ncbi:S9 family peptidase [Cystobacter fuscus]|nr:S9 family peptidase [Cystobacter fuscus]
MGMSLHKQGTKFLGVWSLVVLGGCSHLSAKTLPPAASTTAEDPYLWLEEISSEKSLSAVRAWNQRTESALEARPLYPEFTKEVSAIVLAKDRIPIIQLQEGLAYNFWQDEKSKRGLWRRTSLAEYQKETPAWELLLDVDELAKKENENWVWHGANCLPAPATRCLVSLSRGGSDAAVVREFDLATRDFVPQGFLVPEAKSAVDWYDENHLLIGTDWGADTLTTSGYPRQVRLWTRGQDLSQAKLLMETDKQDMKILGYSVFSPEGTKRFVYREKSFFSGELHALEPGDEPRLTKLPLPEDFQTQTSFDHWLLGSTLKDWTVNGKTYKAGSLLRVDLDHMNEPPTLLFEPTTRQALGRVIRTKFRILVTIQDNVLTHLYSLDPKAAQWKLTPARTPRDGVLSTQATPFMEESLVTVNTFLQPSTLLLLEDVGAEPVPIKRAPERFRANGLVSEQLEATSTDGTKIPYFVVHKKDMPLDGSNPTVLYGYGGFMSSQQPSYLGVTGKTWLERGGVFVIANIRGGGEFGPEWHRAALRENRQQSFDDFASVARDLIARKMTSPRHLGIQGGSNGGLLVGTTFTQHPELFNAVVCQVPLLDMMRYHRLLAGASWMEEYGNPDDPKLRPSIRAYSPYQNLKKGVKYPEVFFTTSTKDDRVHPGHARKMAARMEEQGHPFFYYENIEGGHGGVANLEQRIKMSSLIWTYFDLQLR